MGRNSDKLYLTAKEHAEGPRGYKGPAGPVGGASAAPPPPPTATQQAGRAALPLTHCALTLQPWRDPVCAPDGAIFDVTAAMPYVRKHGKHPITGAPMTVADLTPLNFAREAGGGSGRGGGGGGAPLCCPVTGRVFTASSRLVAVRPTGNVFAAEAVEELCAATRNWRDLLTDEPFAGRKDLIELRPAAASRPVVVVAAGPAAAAAAPAAAGRGGGGAQANASADVKRALAALGTAEASAALARGGGGAAMEAARQAADARVRARKEEEDAAERRRKAGAQEDEDEDDEYAPPPPEGDWRLRGEAPRARSDAAQFKPGARTWDTTSYMGDAAALRRAARQKEVQAIVDGGGLLPEHRAAEGGAAAAGDGAASAAAAAAPGANPTTRPDGTPRPIPRVWYVKRSGHARFETGVETTGAAARSFTSTVAPATARNALVRRRVAWRPPAGTKGYVRLSTTHGDLNFELHADACPLACENFLALCEMGYYDGVAFHRLVRNFVLQGGDPSETGRGGESIFSAQPPGGGGGGAIGAAAFFGDEIDPRLKHDGRGVLAMANSGKNTNNSQFYVTLKSAPALDGKHTVFGRVVGGMDTLTRIERLCCDDPGARERPKERVAITGAKVFVNPFLELAREWDERHGGGGAGAGAAGGGAKRPAEAEAARPAAAAAAVAAAPNPAAAPAAPAAGASKKRAAPSAFDAW